MVLHKYTTSTLSAAIPKGNEPEIKNWSPETFFSTKRKTHKRNIMLENPIKEERMGMIEN